MRAVIVTNSSSYEPRAERVGEFLKSCGHQVLWLESDFNHREKRKEERHLAGHQYIDTVPYKKNMSVRRLYSQYDFARKAVKILERQQVDLLYFLIPANSLVPAAARLKEKCRARLVLDIIDLWPESLPVKRLKKFWPVQCWRRLRDDHLSAADLVLTECRLYQDILKLRENAGIEETGVMYWPKEKEAGEIPVFRPDKERLHIAYLGSVNHIIDMDSIVNILEKVNQKKKVLLHIVGDGESRDIFLQKLRSSGIETNYYGIVYEEEKKKQIFERCSFGINMMKESVCVGLTMKSVDYFCYGLPLINNIQGDTWELVEQYGIGVNCRQGGAEEWAEKILEVSETIQNRRELMRRLYEQMFTWQAMEQVLKEKVLPLLEQGV